MQHRKRSMWAKLLATVLVAVLLMSTVPFTIVYAVEVDTAAELKTEIGKNSTIVLTKDITLLNWTTPTKVFSGSIDGNGHIITTPKTLLGTISANGSVTDLGLVTASGFSDAALLANTLSGSVTGCFAYGEIENTTANAVIGGLIGTMTAGSVKESFASVDIKASALSHDGYVGGLIGKLEGGTVADCYSAGSIYVPYSDYNLCKIAGFANVPLNKTPTVSTTYTSCQIRQPHTRAKASGVDGLYDNQMSIVREGSGKLGVKTRDLMSTTALSDKFAVTGTAYPSLKRFYGNEWGDKADSIVRVSTAAVAFSDVDASKRFEPTTTDFFARADYLTLNTIADRTNGFDLAWMLSSTKAKVYDSVPLTSATQDQATEVGTMTDLLRSRFEFSSADPNSTLTVTSGDAKRTWYLNANTKNPYFNSGTGMAAKQSPNGKDDPFIITTIPHLNVVRHYGLIGSYQYKVNTDLNFNGSNFDPIVDFKGNFFGNSKEIKKIALTNAHGLSSVGLFANVQGATIRYVTLRDATVTAQDGTTPAMGALIGTADVLTVNGNTTYPQVYRNLVLGSSTTITNTATSSATGGLIGVAKDTSVRGNLLSASIKGGNNCGGMVGQMSGSKTMYECGTTGYVIGKTNAGGLIGSSSVKVNDCYSTMAVLSDATGTVNVGGLIGVNNGSLTKSYASSLVYAKNGTGTGSLVGSGKAATNSYSGVGESMIGTTAMTNLTATSDDIYKTYDYRNGEQWSWTKTESQMPQITYFVHQDRFATLSLISTTPVYFQQHWKDAVADNMTTGWIEDTPSFTFHRIKTFASNGSHTYEDKVRSATLSKKSESIADVIADQCRSVYTVASGHGFEAVSSADCMGLIFQDSGAVALRVVGAVRPAMRTLSYEVFGAEGANVFVDLGYSSDKVTYTDSQTKHTLTATNSFEAGPVSYDMPSSQYVRVKVHTNDCLKVNKIELKEQTVSMNYDAATDSYVSASKVSVDTVVRITLEANNNVPWGRHYQHY